MDPLYHHAEFGLGGGQKVPCFLFICRFFVRHTFSGKACDYEITIMPFELRNNLIPSYSETFVVEIAPVLLLVLDRAGPELDRIGAGPIFGPAPVHYLHFCVAHALKTTMLKRLSQKAINLQQLRDT